MGSAVYIGNLSVFDGKKALIKQGYEHDEVLVQFDDIRTGMGHFGGPF